MIVTLAFLGRLLDFCNFCTSVNRKEYTTLCLFNALMTWYKKYKHRPRNVGVIIENVSGCFFSEYFYTNVPVKMDFFFHFFQNTKN